MKRSTVRILLFLVTIVWGSGYVVNEMLLQAISPFQILTGRFLLTFLILAFLARTKIKYIQKNTIQKGIILGILLFTAFSLQTVGLLFTTPSKNAFLTQISVVFVPIISFFFFKQRVLLKTQLGILISLIGVTFMSLNGFGSINIGDVLSILCALFFALQVIMMGQFVQKEDAISLMFIQMGTASILSLSVNIMQRNVYMGGNSTVNMLLIYLAVFGTLFGYGVQTAAQKVVTASEISLVLSLESFWGMMLSIVFLKEVVKGREMFGAWLILIGVLVSQIPFPRKTWKPTYGTKKVEQATQTKK